jgi:hypothetical protein
MSPTTLRMRPGGSLRSPRIIIFAVVLSLAPLANAVARDDNEGVVVRRPSITRRLVSEGALEVHALQQYQGLLRAAQAKSALAPQDHPLVVRLRAISQKIIPHVAKWNEEAKGWKWEVNVIGSPQACLSR